MFAGVYKYKKQCIIYWSVRFIKAGIFRLLCVFEREKNAGAQIDGNGRLPMQTSGDHHRRWGYSGERSIWLCVHGKRL